jgi:hypothetical protein
MLAAICVSATLLIFRKFAAGHGIAIDLSISFVLTVAATFACYSIFADGRATLRESWRLLYEVFTAG